MNSAFLISIILKGIGAILEVVLQILITSSIGVDGYGIYAAWINGADLIFWIALSGLVKCNTFYLSGEKVSLQRFRRKYYLRYALPILFIVAATLCAINNAPAMAIIPIIAGLELMVLDNSSALLAQGQYKRSLFGEYALGRVVLVLGVLLFRWQNLLHQYILMGLYIFQYVTVIVFLFVRRGQCRTYSDVSQNVSLKKWGAFQQSDLMHSMIEQMPVVVQYLFSGAFEAGVVSIVLLVKKLINFISGPTAKVFLPEFSRLYHAGNKNGIRNCYQTIMRIQMMAVGPMAVVLIGYPGVILRILAKELLQYKMLFIACSAIFLLTASLGPCGGILQMTGNEKEDNRFRFTALVAMVLIMLVTRKDSYFVLYGLCGQVALEAIMKFKQVCKWMEQSPVKLVQYLSWWVVPIVTVSATYLLEIQDSFFAMVMAAMLVFAVGLVQEVKRKRFFQRVEQEEK